jgi:hypothetical protein
VQASTPVGQRRIALIADSLALPRPRPEDGGIRFTDTYVYRLEQRLAAEHGQDIKLLVSARRGLLMTDVPTEIVEAKYNGATGAIVHVGICDCGPRVMNPAMRRMLSKVQPVRLRTWLIEQISSNRREIIRWLRPKVYTTVPVFREAVAKIARAMVDADLQPRCFVDIAPPDSRLEYRSPGYRTNVVTYNRVLYEEAARHGVEVIGLASLIESRGGMESLGIDGQHLNVAGNELLAELLLQRIVGTRTVRPRDAMESGR